MKRLLNLLSAIARELGPLLAFYGVNHFYGIKPAIAASLTWAIVEAVVLRVRRRPMSSLFKYSFAMAIVFAVVDLSLATPLLVKYESAIGNILTGLFFALTLRPGKKTVIQEFAENRWRDLELTPDRIFFFRVSTGFWACYFLAKAGFYAWAAGHYSLEEALAIRTVVGNATFYGLMFINIYFARPIRVALAKLRPMPSNQLAPITSEERKNA